MNVVDYVLEKSCRLEKSALLTLAGDYSYAQITSAVEDLARFLVASGARKGDRVILLGDNSFFWVVSYLGTLRAGCVSVPLATDISSGEFGYILESTEAQFAFLQSKYAPGYLAAFDDRALVVIDRPAKLEAPCPVVCLEDARAQRKGLLSPLPEIDDRRDLAALMFTSGSMGKPRGVMVSHGNIMANTASIIDYLGLTESDRVMAVLPFYYCFGTSLLHTHFRVGGSVVIDLRFMFPDKVLERMRQTQCTGFAGVPSHFQILLRNSHMKEMKFPNLLRVQQAGGKLSNKFIGELREALPTAQIFVMYGQTEATARLSYLPPELLDRKLGSIGKGIPGVRLRVVDENGEPITPSQVGEIVAEGENIALGYWRDEEEMALSFRGGRLHTGDLATVDDEGFIYIVDRAKDILKCGGHRVGCKEIEEALLEFDGLLDAAVIGVPDEILGEAVKAFVVPRGKKENNLLDRLQAFCIERFPQYLLPKEVVVLEALPRNSAGKVMKTALKSMAPHAR